MGRRVSVDRYSQLSETWRRNFGHKTVMGLRIHRGFVMLVTYDHAVDQLSLRLVDFTKPVPYSSLLAAPLARDIVYCWEHEPGEIAVHDVAAGTTTMHPYRLDAREIINRSIFTLSARQPPSLGRDGSVWKKVAPVMMPFGDSELLGLPSQDGLQLWFFNPDFAPGHGAFSCGGGKWIICVE